VQPGDRWQAPAYVEVVVKSCVEAVEAFISSHPEVADTPEAAAAWASAREIDDPANSATSKSMMVGRFLDALEVLRIMANDEVEVSVLDEIKSRRDRKLRGSGAQGRVGSQGEATS